jgi:hypothetical protein
MRGGSLSPPPAAHPEEHAWTRARAGVVHYRQLHPICPSIAAPCLLPCPLPIGSPNHRHYPLLLTCGFSHSLYIQFFQIGEPTQRWTERRQALWTYCVPPAGNEKVQCDRKSNTCLLVCLYVYQSVCLFISLYVCCGPSIECSSSIPCKEGVKGGKAMASHNGNGEITNSSPLSPDPTRLVPLINPE